MTKKSSDPTSNKVGFLFHPREQRWNRHFRLNGALIEGIPQVVALLSLFFILMMLSGWPTDLG